jgi:Tol biopolymer transport system component
MAYVIGPGARAVSLLLSLWLVQCGAPVDDGGVEHASVRGGASEGLVFLQIRAGSAELLRARLADGAVREVTNTPEREEMWPYWSDTAGLVVIETRRGAPSNGHQLVVWDPDTDLERSLVSSPASHETWASWAPAGDVVAFSFSVGLGGLRAAGLATATASTGVRRVLEWTALGDRFVRPAWVPSGKNIVVQRRRSGTPNTDLWVVAREAGPARPLVIDERWHDMKASYSQDGAWIVFTRRPSQNGPGDIVRVRADGSQLGRIASLPDSDDHTAAPSPVRDEIAFVSDRDGSQDVFLADLDGGGVRNLTRSPDVDEIVPRWAPNGERIVVTAVPAALGATAAGYTRDEEMRATREAARIFVIDRDGQILFQSPGYSPDWMPPWR